MSKHDVAVDPSGECLARLTRLWQKNLGVPIGGDADYFQMGGDSLLGTQLLSWIHESFGVELSLLDLFEFPTITAQARMILEALAVADHACNERGLND